MTTTRLSAAGACGACWLDEPCGDHGCATTRAAALRAEVRRGAWSRLAVVRETGGPRHYLDGQPIHCGTVLALQRLESRHDDYGTYSVPMQRDHVYVRYEASWRDGELRATLHTDVGGHEFVAPLEAWMGFRWPHDGRAVAS